MQGGGPQRVGFADVPSGPSERDIELDGDNVRDRFLKRFGQEVDCCGDLRVGYVSRTNRISIGSASLGMICDYITIAVQAEDDKEPTITLLVVNGEPIASYDNRVPWKTFITFMRYLYTLDCAAAMMCDTPLIDMLQGVLVKYRRDGIVLEVAEFVDYKPVKKIRLWRKGGRPPFIQLAGAYQVSTSDVLSAERWTTLCATRQQAVKRGFIVEDDAECESEPCVWDDGGALEEEPRTDTPAPGRAAQADTPGRAAQADTPGRAAPQAWHRPGRLLALNDCATNLLLRLGGGH